MSAIAGLMAGAQYFQAPDKPLYVDHIPSLLLWPSNRSQVTPRVCAP